MINVHQQTFHLITDNTSYWLQISDFGHPLHLYYGPRTLDDPHQSFVNNTQIETGTTIKYHPDHTQYSLDHYGLEYSSQGRGDYRTPSFKAQMPDDSFVADFRYVDYEILDKKPTLSTLPSARQSQQTQTLKIILKDNTGVTMHLYYSVYEQEDFISRCVVVLNDSDQDLILHKVMSLQLDLLADQLDIITLHGDWAKETHVQRHPLSIGTYQNQSRRGTSSNQHNPGVMVVGQQTTQHLGTAYGFNLLYSGNHKTEVELNPHGYTRVLVGLNDDLFQWPLAPGSVFESPEALMTYSQKGINGVSQNFHQFIRTHLLPLGHKHPVVYNNWEATRFDFNHQKIVSLAKVAKSFDIETFVLDDGWFGDRQSDHAGLGDYKVNTKRLPKGLKPLIEDIRALGLDFGLWVEPEMVNQQSDLYQAYPEWVLRTPTKTPLEGRNQLVLDLCLKEVQDYIIHQLTTLLDTYPISYIKWDMNRPQSDWYSPSVTNQAMVPHLYMIGLYRVLDEVFGQRPDVTLEMCASGGNRFDLGMLCYASQIWSSDNTDAGERLKIQEGLTYFYPLCTISNHLAASPNPSTLRSISLSTRFNVAFFGSYGLELDITDLNSLEKKIIKDQIQRYKQYRHHIEHGKFSRLETNQDYRYSWQIEYENEFLLGYFQTLYQSSPKFDKIYPVGLASNKAYQVVSFPQKVEIQKFGALLNHVLPFTIKKEGLFIKTVPNYYALDDASETYRGSGALLLNGLILNQQFVSTGYRPDLRMLGDFGSTLYLITEEKE